MRQAIECFLDQHEIRSDRLLVGVSGGADSVALLKGLSEIAPRREIVLVAAHFDHGLRENSEDDADWVQGLCVQIGVPCTLGKPQTPISAVASGSLEEAARIGRYAFLETVARDQDCRWLAVAHTADDQTETILHHILRGSGLRGLQGIPPVRTIDENLALVRPLLSVRRRNVLTYLADQRQEYRSDPTNRDETHTRNRIRHTILPLLREQINPQVDDALRRLGRNADEVQATLESKAAQLLCETVRACNENQVRLECETLRDEPAALVREMFVLLWRDQNWPRQKMNFEHWDRLAAVATNGTPGSCSLPRRIQVTRCRGVLTIEQRPEPA